MTSGQVQVDGTVVHGNSTLFQGGEVAGRRASVRLYVSRGANRSCSLAPRQGLREHAVLERGAAIQRGNSGYALIADGLKVSSLSQQGAVIVGLKGSSHLEVTAQGGVAEVRTLQVPWWLDWKLGKL